MDSGDSPSSSRSQSPLLPAGEPGTCTIYFPHQQPNTAQYQTWLANRNKGPVNDPVTFIESSKYNSRGFICYECGRSKEWEDVMAGVGMRVNSGFVVEEMGGLSLGINSAADPDTTERPAGEYAGLPGLNTAMQNVTSSPVSYRASESLPLRPAGVQLELVTNSTINRFSDPGPVATAPPPIPPRKRPVPEILKHRVEQFASFEHSPNHNCKPDRASVVGIWGDGELVRDIRDWTQWAVDVQFAMKKPMRWEKWVGPGLFNEKSGNAYQMGICGELVGYDGDWMGLQSGTARWNE
ncbi:Protein of unknown function [Pyronema omphalodes CBS 100304]|uniref:Uncharacterized protein n=1 Tax=Pyronema omphalodes (strain CBS 100304) TaxID=1076935 RepID=U4LP53_PYROM|nr:Protein of unknown function [Pyronema omphalodes CBS 100304]